MVHRGPARCTVLVISLCALLTGMTRSALAQNGPALSIDASAAKQHPISPYIYGMNFADEALANELRLPVRRWGGNSTTRYNWQNDTSNHASDWYFENVPNDNANPGALPNGSASDQFIDQDRRTSTKSLITVPLIGWTPKSRAYACGFSVGKYGVQQSVDPWRTDCGNGIHTNGTNVTGNDPTDTSTAITPAFVQSWMQHLIGRYGTAAQGGVQFYNLDNEPMLWNSTHRDVHPQPTSYDEMRDRTYQYAAAIKQTDSGAQTLGPAEWGWTGYFWSALDMAAGGAWWNNPQDRNAHGGSAFTDWYLQQMRAYEQAHGVRILDYLDLHYYPQALGVTLSPAGDASTQALRLRSTRSLWDATYTDESWIATPVRMIPRMRDWVNTNYPGTKTAISEYNWGGVESLNGALTQADVLGIFGREGLDMATMWGPPSSDQPAAYAFRMYRNYDGSGSTFGDTGVQSVSADQSQLAVYGALRSDGALTLMIINKTSNSLTSNLTLAGFNPAATGQVYRYSAANLNAIQRLADQPVSASGFTATYPASSITLTVIPRGAVPGPIDTIGVYRRSSHTFYLRNSNTSGPADIVIGAGDANSFPVAGDWDGDGYDTVGLYNQKLGVFSLYDSNAVGAPVKDAFVFGNPGDQPLSGRWVMALQNDPIGKLGRAHDGVGVFRPSNGLLYLISAWPQPPSLAVYADYTIVLGNPGDVGMAGKWNGGSLDTAAVYRPATTRFYATAISCNGIVPGPNVFCGVQFSVTDTYLGVANDLPVKGDWIGQGKDGIGVFHPASGIFSLKNTMPNSSGSMSQPDKTVIFGLPGDIPLAGHWKPPALGAPDSTPEVVSGTNMQPSIIVTPRSAHTPNDDAGQFD